MKSFIKALSFAAVFGLFATACETDPCKDVVCGDHGSCVEGVCNCETGYEKNADGLCNDEVRAKFFGTWNVADDCSNSGATPYQVIVATLSSGIFDVKISNFWERMRVLCGCQISKKCRIKKLQKIILKMKKVKLKI
jgi:hypothetical protein